MPFDPVSGILGGGQALGGLVQTLFSGKRKAEKNLERHINSYQKNPSIMDYYSKALNNYNANPYNSASYRNATQTAGRGLATGINALGDRRSVLAGLPALTQGYADAGLKAAANAERERAGALSQLGNATAMKAREDRVPFDMKYNLLAQKAAGANATKAAGWKNIFGGLGTAMTGFSPGSKKSTTSSVGYMQPKLNNGWLSGNQDEIINPPV